MILFNLLFDVVGDNNWIKLIEFFLHFFEKILFSGHGKSTTIKPLTPDFLHFFIKLFKRITHKIYNNYFFLLLIW